MTPEIIDLTEPEPEAQPIVSHIRRRSNSFVEEISVRETPAEERRRPVSRPLPRPERQSELDDDIEVLQVTPSPVPEPSVMRSNLGFRLNQQRAYLANSTYLGSSDRTTGQPPTEMPRELWRHRRPVMHMPILGPQPGQASGQMGSQMGPQNAHSGQRPFVGQQPTQSIPRDHAPPPHLRARVDRIMQFMQQSDLATPDVVREIFSDTVDHLLRNFDFEHDNEPDDDDDIEYVDEQEEDELERLFGASDYDRDSESEIDFDAHSSGATRARATRAPRRARSNTSQSASSRTHPLPYPYGPNGGFRRDPTGDYPYGYSAYHDAFLATEDNLRRISRGERPDDSSSLLAMAINRSLEDTTRHKTPNVNTLAKTPEPEHTRPGFTRSLQDEPEVVCCRCSAELGVGNEALATDDARQQSQKVYFRSCGHVYCGTCIYNIKTDKKRGAKVCDIKDCKASTRAVTFTQIYY